MDDRLSRLEATVRDLARTTAALEERLAALEAHGEAAASAADGPAPALAVGAQPQSAPHDLVSVLSLLGRLFIVLGGGYLLRAMTEMGTLAPAAGIGAGLLYAAGWTIAADRAAQAGRRLSADFHGVATALIAFPIIWEATTRFRVFSPEASAVSLVILSALCLAVAWRRRLQTLAWVSVGGALPTAVALLAGTGVVVPFALFVIALGVATLWMGYSLDWLFLRWPVAAVADIIVFGLTLRALSAEPRESSGVVITVQLLLLSTYLVSIAVRTLVRGRNVIPFEVAQTLAALALGFGGAVSVARHTSVGAVPLGVASLVFAVASYGVTFVFIDQHQNRRRNICFYASLALAFTLAGSALVLGETVITATWACLGVVTAWLWARSGRLALGLHSASYLFAAAIVSATLTYGAQAFFGSPDPWPAPGGGVLVIVAASVLCAWQAAFGRTETADGYSHVPRAIIILVLVWALGGALVGWLAQAVAGRAGGGVDPGILATARTCVLAVSTLVVAWIGSHDRFMEWGWLVYPLLVITGFKMVVEDFMRSRPTTLFVALALYGAALILAPRLRRGLDGVGRPTPSASS